MTAALRDIKRCEPAKLPPIVRAMIRHLTFGLDRLDSTFDDTDLERAFVRVLGVLPASDR